MQSPRRPRNGGDSLGMKGRQAASSRRKAAEGGLFVGEIGEDGMQVRKTQDFLCAGAEVHSPEFRLVLARREETADQLPDAGTIEVGNVAKIQQHPLLAILKKVKKKIVDSFAFDERKPAPDVNDRHVAQLSRACTKSQAIPLQRNL